MPYKRFYLLGEPVESARVIELDPALKRDELRNLVAAHFAIVQPNGW